MTNPAYNSGPSGDGSKSLAPESKAGLSVAGVVFFLAQTLLMGLGTIDTSGWTGWWAPFASAALGLVTGLITSYLKRNR